MNYQHKTVVITGAAKGIGAACAQLFLDSGANVALLDLIFPTQLSDEKSLSIVCDVSNEEQVKQAMEKIENHFGSIDYLVNNAGIQRYGTVTETTSDEWDLVMNVNLKSIFLCAKYAISKAILNTVFFVKLMNNKKYGYYSSCINIPVVLFYTYLDCR